MNSDGAANTDSPQYQGNKSHQIQKVKEVIECPVNGFLAVINCFVIYPLLYLGIFQVQFKSLFINSFFVLKVVPVLDAASKADQPGAFDQVKRN